MSSTMSASVHSTKQYRYLLAALFLVTVSLAQTTHCQSQQQQSDLHVGPESMINLFKYFPDLNQKDTTVATDDKDNDNDASLTDSPSILDDTSAVLNNTEMRSARQMLPLIPELLSRLPMGKLFDMSAKALNVARYWPAGLTSLVVGTAPTTGAIVGVISILTFIIIIWLIVYSIGVLPVGAALIDEMMPAYLPPPAGAGMMMPPPGHYAGRPYPNSQFYYNQRAKRSLAEASRKVINSIDQFHLKHE